MASISPGAASVTQLAKTVTNLNSSRSCSTVISQGSPTLTAIFHKAGNDEGDKAGIIFRGSPMQGEVYRQEFSVGNAEDVAEVLTTTYGFGRNSELDRFVPKALADLFCPGDCVVTKEFNPLEPGGFELKYFAPRVGMFLEVNPGTGEVVRLVGCNFDSRCNVLASQ